MAKGKGFKAFEKSGKDVDPKGVKEGSKADKALDKKQMFAGGFRKGGKVGKK
jgi:hypothetical protein